MEAVSQILSSGIFTDLITGMGSGMKDGSLDIGKMMGTVQKLCSTMNVGGADTTNMINSIVGNMLAPKGENSEGDGLDLASLMGSIGKMNENTMSVPVEQPQVSVMFVQTTTIHEPEPQQTTSTSTVEEIE